MKVDLRKHKFYTAVKENLGQSLILLKVLNFFRETRTWPFVREKPSGWRFAYSCFYRNSESGPATAVSFRSIRHALLLQTNGILSVTAYCAL